MRLLSNSLSIYDAPTSSSPEGPRARRKEGGAFWIAVLLLVGIRIPHLTHWIDEPHAWRQMDTAHYIRVFAEDSKGIDLLRPAVAWMGNHKTLILEFPLPEAVAAWTIRVAGADPSNLLIPRLVFSASFLLAVLGFFLLARDLGGGGVATWATLFYLASPLAQVYSRAIHIDFTVLALVHFACFFALRAGRAERIPGLVLASLLATLAAVVKGPALFAAGFMMMPAILPRGKRSFFLKSLPLLLLPLAAFAWWRSYAEAVNGAAPDWTFIPEYHRFTNMNSWYFGTIEQRLRFGAWKSIVGVTTRDVIGVAALPFALAGLTVTVRSPQTATRHHLSAWILGSAAYIFLFFNLNVVHDYYQLPLIAPFALLAGMGMQSLSRKHMVAAPVAGVIVFFANIGWAERRYYQPVGATAMAGEIVRAHTPPGALVIASWPEADPRSPHMLYEAHRYGWSVRSRFLTEGLVEQLRGQGAAYLALLRPVTGARDRPWPGRSESFPFIDHFGREQQLELIDLSGPGAPR